jgi:formate dehydrogenase major subunit
MPIIRSTAERSAPRAHRSNSDALGRIVNRCEGIAWTGGCTDTNEFNYLVVKTMRSLGVVYLENQARV